MTEKINFRKEESQLKLKIHMKLRKVYNEYSLGELNFNLIPSIKKRVDDDTKDYICYSCFKKELDGEISKDIGHQWGNGVIDPSSQLEDSMCNDCFKLELDELSFSLDGISRLSCIQCGLDLEKNNDLLSAIKGVCNHCYLKVANRSHSCIRCDPTFPVTEEANYD
jgi:hypothetical protein